MFTVKWKKVVIECDLDSLKTIGALRTFLKAKTHVPRKKQKLIYEGRVLPVGSATLESLGIRSKSRVVCVGKATAAKVGGADSAASTGAAGKKVAAVLSGPAAGETCAVYAIGDLVTRSCVKGTGKETREVCAVVEVYPGAPAPPEFYTLQVSASADPLRVGREVQVPAGRCKRKKSSPSFKSH